MRDRWPALLDEVAADDGLPVRECGRWTEEKLWLWNRYTEITTTAMGGKANWDGLTYVDLFAGPGVCRIRESGKRLPGSPWIAARAPKPFRKLILIEQDESSAATCEQRLASLVDRSRFDVLRGDCNALAATVAGLIPPRSLTLAFIDPEGLDVTFATLETLAANRRIDFVLLWADAIDLVRNVGAYEQDPESKLYRAFGTDDFWKDRWAKVENRSGARVRQFFAAMYQEAIQRKLGYAGVREKIIRGPHGPLYRLFYASKHERGLQFWDKVSARDLSGQSDLPFGT